MNPTPYLSFQVTVQIFQKYPLQGHSLGHYSHYLTKFFLIVIWNSKHLVNLLKAIYIRIVVYWF